MATLSSTDPVALGRLTGHRLASSLKSALPSGRGVLFCHCYVLATLGVLALAQKAFELSAGTLIYPTCLAFVASCAWFTWSWRKLGGRLLDPYFLFLTAAVLFNGGHSFLEVVGLNSSGLLDGKFPPEVLLSTSFLVLVGLASVHLGALMALCWGCNRCGRNEARAGDMKFARLTAIVGICMIAVSILPWLQALRNSVASVMSHGYFVGLFQQDSATGLNGTPGVLGTFLIPGAFFLLAGSGGRRFPVLSATMIVAGYTGGQLFLGSRAPAVAALAAWLWLYHTCVHPVRRIVVVSLVAVVILLLPFVAATRDLSGEERSADVLLDALTRIDNPLTATIWEMGSSMGVVAHTINLVPSVRPFDMGKSYGFAFLTVFPNLFWDVHPAVSHGLLANWLVWTVDPSRAATGGGLGFSFIAEAYLNFGWWGAQLTLAAMGFLAGTLGRWTRDSRDAAKLAMIASILSFAFILARGESASVVRGIVWYSILPCVAVHVLSRGGSGSLLR